MTRQEFIQEAALRMTFLLPERRVSEIADLARGLANSIYDEEEPEPELTPNPRDFDPVEKILQEAERIDEEETRGRIEEGRAYKIQKKGYVERLRTAFRINGITTLGELLNLGRRNFSKTRSIGELSCAIIDKALDNLYNIKEW